MSAWIGPVGGLVEVLQYKGSLSVATARPTKAQTTLGGRVKVQRGPRSRRVWDASVDGVSPAEAAGLLSLDAGSTPPWVWVDPYAQVTNLLSPEQSVLAAGTWSGTGVLEGGSAVAPDGVRAQRTVLHATGGSMGFALRDGAIDSPPVLPGMPITYSLYVRGTGSLFISYRDWSGAILTEPGVSYSNATFARSSFQSTPPAGAASAHVRVTGALQAGNPALTWTPDVAEWAVGHGCNRAVVEGLSEAIQRASATDADGRWSSLSFTVREVG